MLRSMTGFGKAERQIGTKKISVEIRSLNSKQLDANVRLPSLYREKEAEVRTWLADHIGRGKADMLLFYETTDAEKRVSINRSMIESYYRELKEVADSLGIEKTDFLNVLIRIPDVLKPETSEIDNDEWAAVLELCKEAFNRFDQYRKTEGAKVNEDFHLRIQLILQFRDNLMAPAEARINKVREKLRTQLDEIIAQDKVDVNRFEQELIYYLEKLDVSEEMHRLQSNCDHFLEELSGEASGKKLGFISQEIGREINTIGSKANDADMQRIVVMMKDELEKIKEQINNVL